MTPHEEQILADRNREIDSLKRIIVDLRLKQRSCCSLQIFTTILSHIAEDLEIRADQFAGRNFWQAELRFQAELVRQRISLLYEVAKDAK